MALVCPSCGTENRLAAKFCIECVEPLPVDFAPTQQLPLRASTQKTDDLPEALAAFAAGPASAPAAPLADTAFHVPSPDQGMRPPGKLRAFLVIAAGFALAAAAGWFVASSEETPARVEATAAAPAAVAPAATVLTSTMPVAVAPAAAEPTTAEPTVAAPAVPPAANAPAPAPATREAGADKPAAKAATRMPPAEKTAVPKHAPTAVARESGGLLASCEALNFISRSRCQVEICTRSANLNRAECAPVLEQQRLVEQKRNPQMAN